MEGGNEMELENEIKGLGNSGRILGRSRDKTVKLDQDEVAWNRQTNQQDSGRTRKASK